MFTASPITGVQGGTSLTLTFKGNGRERVLVRTTLSPHTGTVTYACPLLTYKLSETGDLAVDITAPSEIAYFKRLRFEATMTNWGASQLATTGGTPATPASLNQASSVCVSLLRGSIRSAAQSHSLARAKRRLKASRTDSH